MAKKKVIETEDVKVKEVVDKRVDNEIEDLFDVLRSQEEKLQNLYDLEASLKVMTIAVAAIIRDFSDTNEELFHKVRELKVANMLGLNKTEDLGF
jgi:hypothetical protein